MNKQINKKIPIFLKMLVVFFIVLLVLSLIVFGIYKTCIDVSYKHNDEFDQINQNIIDYNIKDLIEYDENNPEYLYLDIPKDLFYSKYLKIDELNTLLTNDYNININNIGIINDDNDDIKVSLDCTYSNKIKLNFYAILYLKYEFVEPNIINFYFKDLIIGDKIPKNIYSKLIPFNQNELFYKETINNELLEKNYINLKNIVKIDINRKNFYIQYDVLSSIKELASDLFKTDFSDNNKYDKVFKVLINTFIDLLSSSNTK